MRVVDAAFHELLSCVTTPMAVLRFSDFVCAQSIGFVRALLLIVTLLGCHSLHATNALPPLDLSKETELPRQAAAAWRLSVYIGEIKFSSPAGTVGRPPNSTVEIQRTLRGDPLTGTREVIWSRGLVPMTDEDPGCSSRPYDPNRPCKRIPHQLSLDQAVVPPAAGVKVIFLVEPTYQAGKFGVLESAIPGLADRVRLTNALITDRVFPAHAKNLATFAKHEQRSEPFSTRFAGLLVLTLLIGSFAAICLAFTLPKPALVVAVMSFVAYGTYESGIDVSTNIRVDLLLIYPLLALNFAAVIVAIHRLGGRNA
jgi:hypothetical protein